MRTAMRPRYYCDYCGKGSGNPAYMKKHERSCTANPNRVCGCCRVDDNVQKPISDLIAALGKGDDEGLKELRILADGCPACMLAAIRQSGIQCGPDEFDFNAAMKEWQEGVLYYDYRGEA